MRHRFSVANHKHATDLATHASIVFSVLGISDFEERFSSNYPPDDHYYLGHALNASVLVCNADEENDATFPIGFSSRTQFHGEVPAIKCL